MVWYASSMSDTAYYKIHAPYGPYARRYLTLSEAIRTFRALGNPRGWSIDAYGADGRRRFA